jgi:cytochrome c oxidase assembly protein subunit 11
MVPIYTVFCEITGFNGTTGRVETEQQYEVDVHSKPLAPSQGRALAGLPLRIQSITM